MALLCVIVVAVTFKRTDRSLGSKVAEPPPPLHGPYVYNSFTLGKVTIGKKMVGEGMA